MVYCSAVGCQNNSSRKSEEISFYRLPRDVSLKKVWINNLKRANLPKEETVRVCHTHFEENCFERDMKVFFFSLLKKFSQQLKNTEKMRVKYEKTRNCFKKTGQFLYRFFYKHQ